jgi:hypothetical protein
MPNSLHPVGQKSIILQILILFFAIIGFVASGIAQELETGNPEKSMPYTGLIKNHTKYDLSIPSLNSGATVVVPAKGWIEYTAWSPQFELDAYYNGKPVWCDKISVTPGKYQYMCKKYDFVAEVVKPEPVEKTKPVPKKRRIKRKPKPKCDEGVKALG